MRRVWVLAVAVLLMWPALCLASTLSYSNGSFTVSTRTVYYVDVLAQEDGVDIWSMRIYTAVSDGHAYWSPGEIASFKDLRWGGTAFDYSPEVGANYSSYGMLRIGGWQGTFSDTNGRTTDYYEFSKTYTIQTGITAVATVRIGAPAVTGDGYTTAITGTYTISNTSGSTFNLWGTGTTAGSCTFAVNEDALTSWAFVNPNNATAKPIVHDTDTTDGHQLYKVTNWMGSTVTSSLPGFQGKFEVKDNSDTATRNMRPGMTFELRADNMSFYYTDQANTMYGSAAVSTQYGVRCHLYNQPGVFGSGATLATGNSTTMNWAGSIYAPTTNYPPTADAGADQEAYDNDQTDDEDVTLDGTASFDSDGEIVSYVWTEGATQIATGANPTVTLSEGTHTLTLTVTDNGGLTASDTVTVTVYNVVGTGLYFTQNGTLLTIIAKKVDDSESYWKMVIDETKGVIKEFYDLDSSAGLNYNYCASYGSGPGLFAPYDSGIRNGAYVYTAGTKTNGAVSYTYTLHDHFGTNDVNWVTSTVTVYAPTPDGTRISAKNEIYNDYAATTSQKAQPYMDLRATSETQMNALYSGSVQNDLGVDGTLWAEVVVDDSTESQTIGLTPGRTFTLTGLLFTDGQLNYDGAVALLWNSTFGVRNYVVGGIYNNYGSKPPAGSTCKVYTRLDINILGTGYIANSMPSADAGDDQNLIDNDDSGAEAVTLDGTGSADADGPIISYVWTEGGAVIATGSTAAVSRAVGSHLITLTVTDENGATASDVVQVNVISRTPTTYYVDNGNVNASDSNPGSAALPWLTIQKAAATMMPGDTAVIKEGFYREYVSCQQSGTASNPITYQAASGERVVISGADELTGWTQLGQTSRNANYANIYYKDITWVPWRVLEDETILTQARSPNTGWWVVRSGTSGTSLVDPNNLTQTDSSYWVGATVFFHNLAPVYNSTNMITAFNPSTDTLTLDPALGSDVTADVDLYYIFNKLELIDVAGEWAIEDLGSGTYRLYVWPSDSQNPSTHMYEATRRNGQLLTWGSKQHIVFDGLEVTGGQIVGINDSFALSSTAGGPVTIQNCTVHGNEYFGIRANGCTDVVIQNCLLFDNGYGVGTGNNSTGTVVRECEIHDNTVDGLLVTYGATDVHIERNYIHDHYLWGHPDNCQTYEWPSDVWFEDNLMVNSGQGVMMEETTDVHFVNNVILGSHAYMLIIGHTNCEDVYVEGNTLAYSGYGLMNNTYNTTTATGRFFKNNIFYQGHTNAMFAAGSNSNYDSDYNVFYLGYGLSGKVVAWDGTWQYFATYVSLSGEDQNSSEGDPLFANAPKLFDAMDANDLPYFTASRVYLRSGSGNFAVGDHIELNFDGVDHTVTTVSSDSHGAYIEFTPALSRAPEVAGVIANWKTSTNFTIDLTLQQGSPAIGGGDQGQDCGSNIDVEDYRNCDFDGDSVRDVPTWPPQ
jgi:parallel beta-helix repeat protein